MHILVVEDERKVASFIKRGLEAANYSVDVEHDGEAGLNRLLKGDYDLVILDVMLPKLDGLSLMKQIRQRQVNTPVLLLTARVTVEEGSPLGWQRYAGSAGVRMRTEMPTCLRREPPAINCRVNHPNS